MGIRYLGCQSGRACNIPAIRCQDILGGFIRASWLQCLTISPAIKTVEMGELNVSKRALSAGGTPWWVTSCGWFAREATLVARGTLDGSLLVFCVGLSTILLVVSTGTVARHPSGSHVSYQGLYAGHSPWDYGITVDIVWFVFFV